MDPSPVCLYPGHSGTTSSMSDFANAHRTDALRSKQLFAGIKSYEKCVQSHNHKIDLQIQSMKPFKTMYFAFRSEFCFGTGPIERYIVTHSSFFDGPASALRIQTGAGLFKLTAAQIACTTSCSYPHFAPTTIVKQRSHHLSSIFLSQLIIPLINVLLYTLVINHISSLQRSLWRRFCIFSDNNGLQVQSTIPSMSDFAP